MIEIIQIVTKSRRDDIGFDQYHITPSGFGFVSLRISIIISLLRSYLPEHYFAKHEMVNPAEGCKSAHGELEAEEHHYK